MPDSSILFAIADGVARITLNRPERLNSLDAGMKRALRDSLGRLIDGHEARVVLLTGAGRAFCSGQDLSERRRAAGEPPPDLASSVREFWSPLFGDIAALPMPVVCAVNGVAAGAGMNLALACDIVLAARSARFIESFAKVGLIPDCGGTYMLPRLAGTARALALAMTATPLSAEQAEAWGLIWRCIDDDRLADEAETLVRQLAQQPTLALGLIKKAIRSSLDRTLDDQLALESELQGIAGRSDDYREGVAAFLEKRTPAFTGR
jgi:2-(1,2-epoxy-1,2-dihydrophenyl)acetyl-CoA isomerase